jgi:hypothetical protein
MRALLILVALVVAGANAARAAKHPCTEHLATVEPEALSWLAGEWIQKSRGEVAREYWSGPVEGKFFGHTVVTVDGRVASFAHLRIVRTEGGISLFANPNGGAAVELKAVEACPGRLVFEGRGPGYPHRIVYVREWQRTLAIPADVGTTIPEERRFRPTLSYRPFPFPL